MNIDFKFLKQEMDQLGITGIFLFGSQAQGLAGQNSDFDFGILLKDRNVLFDYSKKNKIYNKLYDILSSQIKKLVNIDIVFLDNADLQFRHHIAKDGIILYSKDSEIVSSFLEKTMIDYADFAYFRKMFQGAILQRI